MMYCRNYRDTDDRISPFGPWVHEAAQTRP